MFCLISTKYSFETQNHTFMAEAPKRIDLYYGPSLFLHLSMLIPKSVNPIFNKYLADHQTDFFYLKVIHVVQIISNV